MPLIQTSSVQSPKAYDLRNLTADQIAARLAAASNATRRGNISAGLQDDGYAFKIHPHETTADLTDADLVFGFNVGDLRRYACVGDGATDNAANLAKAVAVVNVAGGHFYVPEGVFNSSTAIEFTTSAVKIHGHGYASQLNFTNATDRLSGIKITGTADAHLFHCRVEDVQITGVAWGGVNVSGCGILATYVDGLLIDRCVVNGWSDAGINAVSCTDYAVTDCVVYNVVQGINCFQPSGQIKVIGNFVFDIVLFNGINIEGTGGSNDVCTVSLNQVWQITGSDPYDQPGHAINIEDTTHATVIGNVCFDVTSGNGIHLYGAASSTVIGNVCFACGKSGDGFTDHRGYGIVISANSNNCTVVGNTTETNTSGGLMLDDGQGAHSTLNVLISANVFNEGNYALDGTVSVADPRNWSSALKGDSGSTGTATINVQGSSSAGVATFTTQLCRWKLDPYTGIVDFVAHLAWSAHTGTGNIQIVGLPFAAAGASYFPVSITNGGLVMTTPNALRASVQQGASNIVLTQESPTTGLGTAIPLPAAADITIAGSYHLTDA